MVVYSRGGNTLSVAKTIAKEPHADREVIENEANRKGVFGLLRLGHEVMTEELPPIAEPKTSQT